MNKMEQGTSASAGCEEVDIEANKPLRHGQDRSYEGAGYDQVYHGGGGYVPTFDDEPGPTLESYDIIVRQGFVRKVFGILTLQLGVTFSFTLLCTLHQPTRNYIHHAVWVFILGLVLLAGSLLGILYCEKIKRVYPMNYVVLSAVTLSWTLLLGHLSTISDASDTCMACGTTFSIVAVLMVFAIQTKYDFAIGIGPYLLSVLWVMVIYSFIVKFIGGGIETLYAFFFTIVFSCCIVYDTQAIVGGGHHKYQFRFDDYVFAAITLYLDIINLFLRVSQLFHRR